MTTQEMNKPAPKLDILGNPRFTFALRLLLGTTSLVFGASKLFDLTGFADTVVDYRVLPEALARAYGLALPAVEVVVGICLIFGLFEVRGGSCHLGHRQPHSGDQRQSLLVQDNGEDMWLFAWSGLATRDRPSGSAVLHANHGSANLAPQGRISQP